MLRKIVEEFVTREGTDYGEEVYSLEQKVESVLEQLENGDVAITFDEETETCSISRVSSLQG